MTFINQPDSGGNTMRLLQYKDQLYPPFPAHSYEGIPYINMRNDDVIVCAYPKAGTHWVWEIVRCLQEGTVTVPLIEKDNYMLECKGKEYIDYLPSPRVLNTHLRYDQLPEDVRSKRCKLILINRNPKDLTVSNFHHHRNLTDFYHYYGTWESFFPAFLDGQMDYGSWFDYVKDWERVLSDPDIGPVHVMAYEDIKQDPVKEILRLCRYLELEEDYEFAVKVADKCSFKKMRLRKGQLEMSLDGEPIMYRKGQVGDWVNWFTVNQNDMMDAYYRQLMANSKWTFTYRLDDDVTSGTTGTSKDTTNTTTNRHQGAIIDTNMNVAK